MLRRHAPARVALVGVLACAGVQTAHAGGDGAAPAATAPLDPARPSVSGPLVSARDTQPGTAPERGKWWALGGLAGVYAGLTAFTYFAWYHNQPELPEFTVNGDGMFGPTTYAGGADKLGHLWGNLVISRATTELLRHGGWSRVQASFLASGLSLAFFTYVELKDGFYYQFSTGDMLGNILGAGMSLLTTNVPRIDDLVDFRVVYVPTTEYVDSLVSDTNLNFVEDYSGQTYLVALHLGAIPWLAERPWARWTGYVDVVGGFEARNYKPAPYDADAARRQSLFFGLSLNLQHVLARLYESRMPRRASHRVGHAVFEYVSPPYTTLKLTEAARSPDRP